VSYLEVDEKGLAQLIEKEGKAWLVYELFQNAVDEAGISCVSISLQPVPRRQLAELLVEDDAPEGFRDLTHAYKLFAPSYKKDNPEQRGIWNLGEKLVLCLCESATIISTKGSVVFENGTRRLVPGTRTAAGTRFQALVRMTRAELAEVEAGVAMLIPPAGVLATFNGATLYRPAAFASFECTLPTVIANGDGQLTRTQRKTSVELFEPQDGVEPYIYEMGIPVRPLLGGEPWHINVQQKVPVNMQRNNVSPGYLRTLRVHAMNAMAEQLREKDVTQPWARDAASDERCSDRAVERSLDLRFGDKRVAFDPSDPEANKRAVSEGYTVIHGPSLSKEEWANVKRIEGAPPAGKVVPTPKAYAEGGAPVDEVPEDQWGFAQLCVAKYIRVVGEQLLGFTPCIRLVKLNKSFAAVWSSAGELHLNVRHLRQDWFAKAVRGGLEDLNALLIHEFAHDTCGDHLDSKYHEACCELGAKLAKLALDKPELFKL
jgi:hypothetical protein